MNAGRKRLLAVWVLLAVLVGVIVMLQVKNRAQLPEKVAEQVHGVPGSRMLLPVPIEQVSVVELVAAGTQHRFERDATGTWFYHGVHSGAQAGHAHQTDPRQAAIIDKALTGFGRTRMERELEFNPQANAYGVNMPQLIVLVYGKDNPLPLAQFAIGDLAPDGFSRYVFRVGGSAVVTIANYQIENLNSLIAAVSQQPPASGAVPARR